MTFAALFKEYVSRHAKPRKRTWAEDEAKYRLYLERPLGARKLSEITRSDVAHVHSAVTSAGKPTTANRVLALVSSVFGGLIPPGCGPPTLPRVFDAMPRSPGIGSSRRTSYRAFSRRWRRSRTPAPDYPDIPADWRRRANVLAMKWNELDLGRAEWRHPPNQER